MSDLTNHLRIQFADNVGLLLQQKGSKLRNTVTAGSYKGKAASVVDQFGPTAAVRRAGKYAAKTPANTPTDRRWVHPIAFDWMDFIDSFDKLQSISDPQSSYAQNATYALGRSMDDVILEAMYGTSKTGEQGGTDVTWDAFIATNATTAKHRVAVSVGGANSGLNVAKLRAGKKALMAAEVDIDNDPLTAIITSEEHDALLNEVQVISSDFNGADKPVLMDGKVTRFLGIDFVHCERVPVNGSSQRRVPLFAKSGVHLGVWEDIKTGVTVRKDLQGDPFQVDATGIFGATRTEEKKLVEILCA